MTDIVERLSQIANAKMGDPMPECLRRTSTFEPMAEGDKAAIGLGINNWATPLSALAAEAIAEILRLRHIIEQMRGVAGMASTGGPTFADIKREIKGK